MDISINAVRHENVTVTISNDELVKSLKSILKLKNGQLIARKVNSKMEENRLCIFETINFKQEELRELTAYENEYFMACLTIENYLKHHVKQ